MLSESLCPAISSVMWTVSVDVPMGACSSPTPWKTSDALDVVQYPSRNSRGGMCARMECEISDCSKRRSALDLWKSGMRSANETGSHIKAEFRDRKRNRHKTNARIKAEYSATKVQETPCTLTQRQTSNSCV